MPVIPCNPKNLDSSDKNKENQKENNEEEKKNIQTVFVRGPIFFNPMIKPQKGFYGKYPKKKTRPFTERTGDWICKNLNFAFRNVCNRCKMAKKDCIEIIKNNEENQTENKANNSNKKIYKYKKHFTNQFNDKENAQKEIDLSLNQAEKSYEE